MNTDQSPAEAHGSVLVPIDLLEAASASIGDYCSDLGWDMGDMNTMDRIDALIAQHAANPQPKGTAEVCAICGEGRTLLMRHCDHCGSDYAGSAEMLANAQAPAPAPEPVAVRYDFDGYGWKYIDNGSGSDWMTRHPDGELLFDGPSPAVTHERLHTFLNAAAGEGFVLDGVDAADLYIELFPERYAAAVAQIDTGSGEGPSPVQPTGEVEPISKQYLREQVAKQMENVHKALATQSPAEQPDMFWDAANPEIFSYDIEGITAECGPGEIVKIDCAKRLPSFSVKVLEDGYERIEP